MRHRPGAWILLLLGLLAPAMASGQSISMQPSGAITTAGADCSTATNCAGFSVDQVAGFTVYIDVGTSGTFVFEATHDATGSNASTGPWFAVSSSAGSSSATTDGPVAFTNLGWRRFRVRASAISGAAALTSARGFPSGAGNAGAGDASESTLQGVEANTSTSATHLATLAGTVSSGRVNQNIATIAGQTPYFAACEKEAQTYLPINVSSATTTQLVAASASDKVYICGLTLFASAADNVVVVEDDTSACASPTAGIWGGTTTGTGWQLAANQGFVMPNTGKGIGQTAAVNRYVCIITSSTAQLTGGIHYVLEP